MYICIKKLITQKLMEEESEIINPVYIQNRIYTIRNV